MCFIIDDVIELIVAVVVGVTEIAGDVALPAGVAALGLEGSSLIACLAGDPELAKWLGTVGKVFGDVAGVTGGLTNFIQGAQELAFAGGSSEAEIAASGISGGAVEGSGDAAAIALDQASSSVRMLSGLGSLALTLSGKSKAASYLDLVSSLGGSALSLADVGETEGAGALFHSPSLSTISSEVQFGASGAELGLLASNNKSLAGALFGLGSGNLEAGLGFGAAATATGGLFEYLGTDGQGMPVAGTPPPYSAILDGNMTTVVPMSDGSWAALDSSNNLVTSGQPGEMPPSPISVNPTTGQGVLLSAQDSSEAPDDRLRLAENDPPGQSNTLRTATDVGDGAPGTTISRVGAPAGPPPSGLMNPVWGGTLSGSNDTTYDLWKADNSGGYVMVPRTAPPTGLEVTATPGNIADNIDSGNWGAAPVATPTVNADPYANFASTPSPSSDSQGEQLLNVVRGSLALHDDSIVARQYPDLPISTVTVPTGPGTVDPFGLDPYREVLDTRQPSPFEQIIAGSPTGFQKKHVFIASRSDDTEADIAAVSAQYLGGYQQIDLQHGRRPGLSPGLGAEAAVRLGVRGLIFAEGAAVGLSAEFGGVGAFGEGSSARALADGESVGATPTATETADPTLPAGQGFTDKYGNVTYSSQGTAEDIALARAHESIHSSLSPTVANSLQEFRADVAMTAYQRSSLLRYVEEAAAETYAQVSVKGLSSGNVLDGLSFPLKNGYVTLGAASGDGLGVIPEGAIGVIVVGGYTYAVYTIATKK